MQRDFYPDSRPWTRWWWFSGEIRREDVTSQLDWMRDHGFGGAEIAFLYPLPGGRPGPAWLSPEWSSIVAFAKSEASARGLGLDFTFGTLWPFGGSIVEERDASRTFDGPLERRLRRSWEEPAAGRILNHLDRRALERYASRMGSALREALRGRRSGLFCDSWEVPVEKLWTDGFDAAFRERFGYELEPFMSDLDAHPEVRYDYRSLLSQFVLEQFYVPYGEVCRRLGGFSRVQCHGAPTDLIAAYAAADVPESEAILFDPHFSQLAASAAALAGKPIVSCETFTCLYGWIPHPGPGPYQGREQIADLKLLADAVLANGVNFMVWHGMPYNPPGGGNRFYASVEVGPDAPFASDLPAFNAYLERACHAMSRGATTSRLAVYLPLEDNRMRNRLPGPLRRPSAEYYWELQHQRFPVGADGYRPLWVTAPFLADASFEDSVLRVGHASFRALLVDVEWLEAAALADVLRLARLGMPVCLRGRPRQPGARKTPAFDRDLAALASLACVGEDLRRVCPTRALVEGKDLPEFWAREDGDETLFFFAHPMTRALSYPMAYGQSLCRESLTRTVTLRPGDGARSGSENGHGRAGAGAGAAGGTIELELRFTPYSSLMVTVGRSGAAKIEDLGYVPPEPATESRNPRED